MYRLKLKGSPIVFCEEHVVIIVEHNQVQRKATQTRGLNIVVDLIKVHESEREESELPKDTVLTLFLVTVIA